MMSVLGDKGRKGKFEMGRLTEEEKKLFGNDNKSLECYPLLKVHAWPVVALYTYKFLPNSTNTPYISN